MIELIFLLPAVALGFLLWRADRRHDLAEHAWRLERIGLISRIQNPEIAATLDAPEPSGEVLHVPVDDDRAYEQYIEDREAGEVT